MLADEDTWNGCSSSSSRSTGKPKGVMIEHVAVMNVLEYFAHELGLSPNDIVLGLTTFCFDISVLEMFMPLVTGARLLVVSSKTQKEPRLLSKILDSPTAGITVMQATPATFEMLMACGWQGSKKMQALCGGEAFRLNLAPLVESFQSFRNVYGPTEATIWSTCYHVKDHPTTALPLGDAIWDTQLCILDPEHLKPCKTNQEGELCIGGIGLARGYLNRPELTQEKFFIHTVQQGQPPVRIYRTGDVVMYTDKGELKYMGRSDNQVKINGFRIELGEIEKVLQMEKAVLTAVVVAREDTPTGKALVAYVKPKQGMQIDTGKLQAGLHKTVPPYMVPPYFVFVEDFTYTPNQKIDRKALPPPTVAGGAGVIDM